MLKFGFRNKQLYPLMLLFFAFLRKCLELILDIHPYKENNGFITMFLLFFAQTLVSSLIYFYYSKNNNIEKKFWFFESIKLFNNKFHNINDNKTKIIFLIVSASVFYFV